MIKKNIIFILVFITFLTSFSSCKGENKSEFIHYISSEPSTLDPQTAKDDNSKLIVANTYDGLTVMAQNGSVALNLAESYEYHPNDKTYEFKLKEGLKWANGTDLTANDFVFAFKRIFDKKTKAEGVEVFYCIKNSKQVYNGEISSELLGIKALDNNTLAFELEYNYHSFLELLSLPIAMPCNEEFFNGTKGKYGLESDTILINGAFEPYAWYHGEALYFKRNNNSVHSNNSPKLLTLFINEDYSSADLLLSGSNDVVVTEDLINDSFVSDVYSKRVFGLLFNTDREPYTNLNFRKALSFAFNRESISDNLPYGYKINTDLFSVISDNYSYDVNLAKDYLDKAYLELDIDKISRPKIICKKNEKSIDALMFALQYWQENLNIYFIVEELDSNEYYSRLENKDYDVALVDYILEDNKISFLQEVSRSLNNEEISYNVSEYFLSDSLEKAKILRDDAFKALAEELVLIPAYNNERYIYYSDDIKGLEYSAKNSYIRFVNASK